MYEHSAQASDLSIVGALSYGLFNSNGLKGALGFGGGLSRVYGIGSNGLEFSAIYVSRAIDVNGTTSRSGFMHAPVLFRFGGKTSIGVGGFYNIGFGDASDNYGLAGSARIALAPKFFVDGRFNFDLKNTAPRLNEILFLVGVTL